MYKNMPMPKPFSAEIVYFCNMSIVRAKKSLGQHFLRDQNIARKITDSLLPVTRDILEIGPGMGVLTRHLFANPAFSVRAIDIDQESIDYLHQELPEYQDRILYGDFLKTDIRQYYQEPFSVIGNLPYNISSQIFFRIIENRHLVRQVVCMIQKEVAERIAASPGSKTYGILSVFLQAFYHIEYLFTVGEKVFDPPPKVKSAVIRLTRNERVELGCEEKLFFNVVKTGFNQRRKTLRNSIRGIIPPGFDSGLDIPNANTMIINQAQNYGLSDLHQLRGRVGRSNKKAFCYLLTPPLDTVNSDARRRLKAIEDFSGLGSGFNIAMQDLDIRGAGNILGAEQSGFIAEIGYETYQRILNEALLELREEEFPGMETPPTEQKQAYVADCVIESDFEVLIPDTYVENISERIRLYRELDNIPDEAGLEKFGQELKDRFGEIPAQVTGLMEIVRMRRRCMDLGIERLLVKNGKMIMYFVGEQTSPFYQSALFAAILRFVQLQILPCRFSEKNNKLSLVFTEITNIMKMSRYVREMWEKTEAGNR